MIRQDGCGNCFPASCNSPNRMQAIDDALALHRLEPAKFWDMRPEGQLIVGRVDGRCYAIQHPSLHALTAFWWQYKLPKRQPRRCTIAHLNSNRCQWLRHGPDPSPKLHSCLQQGAISGLPDSVNSITETSVPGLMLRSYGQNCAMEIL